MPGDSDRRSGFKTTSSRRSAPVRSIRRPCAEEPLQDSIRDSRTGENPLSVESGALNRSEASPAPTPVPLLQRSCAQRDTHNFNSWSFPHANSPKKTTDVGKCVRPRPWIEMTIGRQGGKSKIHKMEPQVDGSALGLSTSSLLVGMQTRTGCDT